MLHFLHSCPKSNVKTNDHQVLLSLTYGLVDDQGKWLHNPHISSNRSLNPFDFLHGGYKSTMLSLISTKALPYDPFCFVASGSWFIQSLLQLAIFCSAHRGWGSYRTTQLYIKLFFFRYQQIGPLPLPETPLALSTCI